MAGTSQKKIHLDPGYRSELNGPGCVEKAIMNIQNVPLPLVQKLPALDG